MTHIFPQEHEGRVALWLSLHLCICWKVLGHNASICGQISSIANCLFIHCICDGRMWVPSKWPRDVCRNVVWDGYSSHMVFTCLGTYAKSWNIQNTQITPYNIYARGVSTICSRRYAHTYAFLMFAFVRCFRKMTILLPFPRVKV